MHSQSQASDNISNIMNVGVYISPPFVMETDGDFSGMSIELWEHIAKHLDINYEYKIYDSIDALVLATITDSVSTAVTNLTITKERAQVIDFTQPWYDAGLKIMIVENKGSSSHELISGLHEAGYLKSYLFLGVIVILLTISMTICDRKYDKEFSRSWRDGLAESYYQVMLMFTKGTMSRKNLFGWFGRITAAIWLAVGILVVAYVTSTITSVMTTLSLSNQITELADLNGKKVAVLKGSQPEDYMRSRGFDYVSFQTIDEMVEGLENNLVDAVVGDIPVLEYYEFTHQNKSLLIVGTIFNPDKYGFGISPTNSLKKKINLEVLKAQESGYIRKLRSNYFGQAE